MTGGLALLVMLGLALGGCGGGKDSRLLEAEGESSASSPGYEGVGYTRDENLSGPASLRAGECGRFAFRWDHYATQKGLSIDVHLELQLGENAPVGTVGFFFSDPDCLIPIVNETSLGFSFTDMWTPGEAPFYFKASQPGDFEIRANGDLHAVQIVSTGPLASLAVSGTYIERHNLLDLPCGRGAPIEWTETLTLRNVGSAVATGLTFRTSSSLTRVSVTGNECGPAIAPGAACRVLLRITSGEQGFFYLLFGNGQRTERVPVYMDLRREECPIGV